MANHTAAEVLAAIDIVTGLPDTGRLRAALANLRDRIEQRAEHDQAIGHAFLDRYGAMVAAGPDAVPAEVGALIRAAVEKTGSTITEPTVADEAADGTYREA
ncbi:hypothetical protein [Nocardia sp. NPDC055049]